MNTVHTFCRYGLQSAMLLFLMPKPPVPAVPKAVHRLSNRGMPPASRNNTHRTVSTMYILYSRLAVWRMRGTILPTLGPGLSARSRWML